MTKRDPFKYFHSSPEIIRLAVMMYVRFPLSLRNVEDLLHERGIDISHETVRFWWNRVGPVFAAEIRRCRVALNSETRGVDKTWGSCGAFSVCDGQPTIENCGPCDGYSVSPFGRPPHPSALSHAGIGNVID